MDKAVYVCTGKCGAEITQEQYDEGLTACGAKDCDHEGKPFEKRVKCDSCGSIHKQGKSHDH